VQRAPILLLCRPNESGFCGEGPPECSGERDRGPAIRFSCYHSLAGPRTEELPSETEGGPSSAATQRWAAQIPTAKYAATSEDAKEQSRCEA